MIFQQCCYRPLAWRPQCRRARGVEPRGCGGRPSRSRALTIGIREITCRGPDMQNQFEGRREAGKKISLYGRIAIGPAKALVCLEGMKSIRQPIVLRFDHAEPVPLRTTSRRSATPSTRGSRARPNSAGAAARDTMRRPDGAAESAKMCASPTCSAAASR